MMVDLNYTDQILAATDRTSGPFRVRMDGPAQFVVWRRHRDDDQFYAEYTKLYIAECVAFELNKETGFIKR